MDTARIAMKGYADGFQHTIKELMHGAPLVAGLLRVEL